jgi:hypothetical protein
MILPAERSMESNSQPEEAKKPKPKKRRMILGIVLVIIGLLVLAGGISVLVYNILDTDSEGYAYSNVYHVNTSTYAFALYMNPYKISTWGFLGATNVAEIKFIVKPTPPSTELFTGYATTAASEPYLQSFEAEIPVYWRWWAEPYYAEISINPTAVGGTGAPPSLPQNQDFWVASAHSTTDAEMTSLPLNEQYIWFIMNQDGAKNVSADIQIAFRSPILTVLPYLLIPLGAILALVGVYLIILWRKKQSQERQ